MNPATPSSARRRWWLVLPLAGAVLLVLPGCPAPYSPPLPRVRPGLNTFAAASAYSMRVGADGTLWSTNGDVLLDSGESMEVPDCWVRVGTEAGWTQVAAGHRHVLVGRADGRLFAWGTNVYGQLGTPPDSLYHARPQPVPGRYVRFSTGDDFSLALTATGQLWAWGLNTYGQLGPAATRSLSARPVQVPGQWTQASAGSYHSLAIDPDGRVWAWGSNQDGQLGPAVPGVPRDTAAYPRPVLVPLPGRCVQVVAGDGISLAVLADGQLWAWGDNSVGQLAMPASEPGPDEIRPPVPVPHHIPGHWARVAAGSAFVLALRPDGQLWAWGSNNANELSRANNEDSAVPAPVPAPVPGRYVQMAAGFNHVLALGTDSVLYIWGSNEQGKGGTTRSAGAWGDEGQPAPLATENE